VKLRREAVIPIGPTLVEQLHRQEESLTTIYGPDGTSFLLPSPPEGKGSSRGGGHHITPLTARLIVKAYVRKAEIRDSHGRLAVWVHPHRFRHHLGSSMVNDGVPLSVIQRVLDHASIEMTARYAHLDDETVKREIARFHERVDIRGERIALPVDGPLEQAAWMKERIARQAGAAERILRAAARSKLPAPERVPELRELPHRQIVPTHPPAAAPPHPDAARTRTAGRERAARGAAGR
jgi:hypothetical protein